MALIILARQGQASFGAADYNCLPTTGNEQASGADDQRLLNPSEHAHFHRHSHYLLIWR